MPENWKPFGEEKVIKLKEKGRITQGIYIPQAIRLAMNWPTGKLVKVSYCVDHETEAMKLLVCGRINPK